jgi:hypothetical protein
MLSPVTGAAIYTAFPAMKETLVIDAHYDLALGRSTSFVDVISCLHSHRHYVDAY